jgi:hypothetical protein
MALTRKEVGVLAFFAGLFIAFFLALIQPPVTQTTQILALGLLGISIGLLNIDVSEMELFMVGATAVVFASSAFAQVLDVLPAVSGILERLLANIVYIIAPAAALIALRIVYEAAKSWESVPSPLRPWKAAAKPRKGRGRKRRRR